MFRFSKNEFILKEGLVDYAYKSELIDKLDGLEAHSYMNISDENNTSLIVKLEDAYYLVKETHVVKVEQ